MLGLLIIIALGTFGGWFTIWWVQNFVETKEERAQRLINMVVIDSIMIAAFSLAGPATLLTLLLIFKYAYLCIIDFDKALD